MHSELTLPRAGTALLLVDIQEEQRAATHWPVHGFGRLLANAARLLAAARDSGRPVFHAAYRRDFTQVPPRKFEHLNPSGHATFSDADSSLIAICPEVAPSAGEHVIYKNDASAFCEGTLQPLLDAGQVEWLVVCGVWTEACVAATVRDAMAAGLRVLLVKDACGSGSPAMHETGILNLANRLYGGAVTDTDRATKLLSGDPARAWRPQRPVPILWTYADVGSHYAAL